MFEEGASDRVQCELEGGLGKAEYLEGFYCSAKSNNGGNGRKCAIRGTNKATCKKWVCQGFLKS